MRSALLALAAVSFLHSPIAAGEDRFSKFVTVQQQQGLDESVRSLTISTRVGYIKVVRSETAEMSVEADVRVDRNRVDVTQVGKNFEDHVRIKRDGGAIAISDAHDKAEDRNAWSISLKVALPRALPITAHTGVGNIQVEMAAGKVALATGVGTVMLEAQDAASVSAKSGVGDVELRLGKVDREVDAAAGSGDVKLHARRVGGKLTAQSGRGDVSLKISERAGEDLSVDTGVGSLELDLPQDAAGRFELSAAVGSITVEPSDVLKLSRSPVGASASGQIGKEGPKHKLHTGVGSITLRVGSK